VADAPAPPTAGSGIGGNDADQQMRALVARERQLHEREQEMASRERELTEQRRVLTEQYRLLRAAPAAAALPVQSPASAAAVPGRSAAAGAPSRLDLTTKHAPQGWPSARTMPGSNVPAGASPRGAAAWPNRVYRSRRPGFWRRVKHTLLGSQEPVLEDSL
jgi:hypothetical protein